VRFHLFEAGAFVTPPGSPCGDRCTRVSTYLKLELSSRTLPTESTHPTSRVSTYLKLELSSHPIPRSPHLRFLRFHLFEAGAFVTSCSPRIHPTLLMRFHLLEAGAFVTKDAACGLSRFIARFHLFEAGAFVTTPSLPQSVSQKCVSTYLKLELSSHALRRCQGMAGHPAFPPI